MSRCSLESESHPNILSRGGFLRSQVLLHYLGGAGANCLHAANAFVQVPWSTPGGAGGVCGGFCPFVPFGGGGGLSGSFTLTPLDCRQFWKSAGDAVAMGAAIAEKTPRTAMAAENFLMNIVYRLSLIMLHKTAFSCNA